MIYEWGSDVVRDVGNYFIRSGGRCKSEGVLIYDFDICVLFEGFFKYWEKCFVEFNSCDFFGFFCEFLSEDSKTWTNFDYMVFVCYFCGFNNFFECILA